MTITRLFDEALSKFQQNIPFVIYRKPGESHINFLFQDDSNLYRVKDFQEHGFVMAPFDQDAVPILLPAHNQIKLEIQGPILDKADEGKQINTEESSKTDYLNAVTRAIELIDQGEFNKVVLSRKIVLPYAELPLDAFQALLAKHPSAFCYLWYHSETGIWLGATPELFLLVKDQNLSTFSLAGTKPITDEREPVWSVKETEEQRFVTSYILDQLSQLGIEAEHTIASSSRAGHLWHLKSVITANTSGRSIQEVIRSLHPTPAVCGLPKTPAIQFINTHENYDRKFYTGYLGELNLSENEQCHLFVNLRCMEWRDQRASIYVGGGITQLSKAEEEWEETRQKSMTILSALLYSQK